MTQRKPSSSDANSRRYLLSYSQFRAVFLSLLLVASAVAIPLFYTGGPTSDSGVARAQSSINGNDADVVYFGTSGTVKALDTSDKTVIWSHSSGLSGDIENVVLSPDGSTLYVSDTNNGRVAALDASTGDELWGSNYHSSSVQGLGVSPNGEYVYSASQDDTVKKLPRR